MSSYTYEYARRVRNNVSNALWQLNSFVNILNQNINVNGETLDKNTVKKLNSQLNNSLYYLNYTILPTALNSDD